MPGGRRSRAVGVWTPPGRHREPVANMADRAAKKVRGMIDAAVGRINPTVPKVQKVVKAAKRRMK